MSNRVPFVISKTVSTRIRGVRRGTIYPYEAINHHAPLTPRSTPSTGLLKRASECMGTFSRQTEKQKAKLFAIKAVESCGQGAVLSCVGMQITILDFAAFG